MGCDCLEVVGRHCNRGLWRCIRLVWLLLLGIVMLMVRLLREGMYMEPIDLLNRAATILGPTIATSTHSAFLTS